VSTDDQPARLRPDDHLLDADAGGPTLIQYGDYECPFCRRDEPGLARLLEGQSGKARFVFRHFPAEEHPNAERAAQAAEAAELQGGFWAMHRQLMLRQPPLDETAIGACAEGAGLAVERLGSDLPEPSLLSRVHRDLESGKALGVRGTPWYLLDGVAAGPLPALAAKLRAG